MLYCRVENNMVVEGPCALPKTWNNISNFPALSDAEKIARGWYPVEGGEPAHDDTTQSLTGPDLTVKADRVVGTWTVSDRTLEAVKQALIETARGQTRTDILAAASEEDQRNAVMAAFQHWQNQPALMSMEEVNATISAVDSRRATYHQKKAAIEAAATVADALAAAA